MLFEVNSFSVAKGIDYVIQRDEYREPDLVVILPKGDNPLPRMVHGDDWKIVECFLIADFDRSTIEKYKANNAIILSINTLPQHPSREIAQSQTVSIRL